MGPEGQVVPRDFLRHLSNCKFKARMRGFSAILDLCHDLVVGQKRVTRVPCEPVKPLKGLEKAFNPSLKGL